MVINMTRLQKLISNMPDETDCALITSDINRRYFTGFKSSAGMLALFKNAAYLLIDFRYYENAKSVVEDCAVIKTDNFYKQLQKLFSKNHAKTVSIEAQKMTVAGLEHMQKAFKDIEIDASSVLSEKISAMRAVKSAAEAEKIKTAQRIAENAFDFLLDYIKPDVTEKQLALLLNDYIYKNAEGISFDTIVLSGANTSVPHGVPSDKGLKKGEFILIDFGAVYEGYRSDMTRTVCLGQPDGEMADVYAAVLKAQEIALANLKPGLKCKAFDGFARKYIDGLGYKDCFGHGLGHGVGLEVHEKPTASPFAKAAEKTKLTAGNVITCEPGIYLSGRFGVRIEDLAYVTEDGYENLTGTSKKLITL